MKVNSRKRYSRRIFTISVMAVLLFVTTLTPIYTSGHDSKAYAASTTKEVRNVMYYGDWSIWGGQGNFYPKDIPADQLTHLNFAFLDFDANGNLVFTDKDAAVGAPVGQAGVQWGAANAGILMALQQLRAENPNLKIGISIGGWSKSGDFSVVAADSTKRAKLVSNVMKFVKYTNMDFVDLDWEFPGDVRQPDLVDNKNDEGTKYARPEDKANFITLLQDLRAALNTQGADIGKYYELTVALPAPKAKVDLGIDVAKLFAVVDFANIMSYDMRGAWDEYSGHHTGLYPNPNDPLKGNNLSVHETVQYLLQKGAQPNQIVVGAAYYTRGWEKVSVGPDASLPGLFGKAELIAKDADLTPTYGAANEAALTVGDGGRRSGSWAYRSINALKAKYPNLKEYWDNTAKAPYLYDAASGAFFTYDNVRSIQEKAKYVLDNNLGGMIAWMASEDNPTTSTKRDELAKATKQGLFGSSPLAAREIKYSKLNVTVTITPYTENWGTGKGYDIKIVNNERLSESDAVLKEVELGAKSIKLPKYYIKANGALTSGDYSAGTVTQENGYTVVDLKSVYDGKLLSPNGTYTFKLKGDAVIDSIELVQRVSDNSPEIGRQTVFGSTTPVNQAPVLSGVANKTITVGDSFDPKSGVSATDKEDGDLTAAIQITGTVNTAVAGNYTLTYSVADSKGLVTQQQRIITVAAVVNEAPVFSGVTNKTITVGESFDPKSGVTATDKEDGDLTVAIQITGTVNPAVAGTYTLTYSVADSKGLVTQQQRIITVAAVVNEAPVFSGVTNKTITVGEAFDPKSGVTATDKEDGDLTAAIQITGTINPTIAGTYTLTYSVTDSKGLSTQLQRVITVTAASTDTFDPAKVYVKGDVVIYKGVKYTAKWWTQGGTPDSSQAWEKETVSNGDGSVDYISGTAYTAGNKVRYDGKVYEAKWWTNSVPGSDSSWQLIS
ncbi:hypothetical protein GCM10008013_31420 [Paenibacillus segetis]|uniref:chitinase n=2 Tax=Paenibacillus segetis TaxID=1325360 RepID=A0ABQ1YJZ5_9BACL|nr:glycosyl hydrolase family 18 protein [Paenibacillus segetis]GGH29052.1 hypothetical protein GCM10008013_31420 [Paenibacillus segetis]